MTWWGKVFLGAFVAILVGLQTKIGFAAISVPVHQEFCVLDASKNVGISDISPDVDRLYAALKLMSEIVAHSDQWIGRRDVMSAGENGRRANFFFHLSGCFPEPARWWEIANGNAAPEVFDLRWGLAEATRLKSGMLNPNISSQLPLSNLARDVIGLACLVKGHPDINDPSHAEDKPSASDRDHGKGCQSHILLGLEVGLFAFVVASGSIGGSRATRNAKKMNLTHVVWWLVYFWFGSLSVAVLIGLTIFGK